MILYGWVVALGYGQDIVDIPAPIEPTCADALWPGDDWPSEAPMVRRELTSEVAALDAALFPPDVDYTAKDRAGTRTDGVVVLHRGRIVYERYREPWTKDRPHLTWSVSKSFTNALTGIAEREGLLSRRDSICAHYTGLPEASCAVTIQDLLDMGSGFTWRETYEGSSPTTSSVLAMLYGEGAADTARFVGRQPLARAPGAAWQYSSGDTNLLAGVIGGPLTQRFGERFPWTSLFDVIGMKSAAFERDAAGTYIGSSYVWATPRDLARFGYLMLHDGCWNSERVLPEGWVAFSTELGDPIQKAMVRDPDQTLVQARLFWVNQPMPQYGLDKPWCPSVGTDMFAALGHWGQSITVVPSQELVVVRVADDRDETYKHDRTLKAVLRLVEAW